MLILKLFVQVMKQLENYDVKDNARKQDVEKELEQNILERNLVDSKKVRP